MLTKTEKQILTGERIVAPNYERKVLCVARRKARAALEDLIFLSRIDAQTKDPELNSELLLGRVTSYLEREKIPSDARRQFRHDVMEKPAKKRKGLPRGEKKRLCDAGQSDLAHTFDGKEMVQVAGTLHDKNGGPLKKRLGEKYGFAYELAQKIYDTRDIGGAGPLEIIDEGAGGFSEKNYTKLSAWLDGLEIFEFPDLAEFEKLTKNEADLLRRYEEIIRKRMQDIQTKDRSPNRIVLWRY